MHTPKPTGTTVETFTITDEKLFDRQDLLQMLNISVRTLQYWRSEGIIRYTKIRNKIFYFQKDVEEMLQKNRVLRKGKQS